MTIEKCPKCGIKGERLSDRAVYETVTPSTKGNIKLREVKVHIIDGPDCLRRQLAAMTERADMLQRRLLADATLTISERCAKYHTQMCHVCESLDCCDNTSLAKAERDRLAEIVELLRKQLVHTQGCIDNEDGDIRLGLLEAIQAAEAEKEKP